MPDEPRIGVYVCHCGGNISDVVDVDRVADEIGRLPGVDVARHIMFMCSDEGQAAISEDIAARGLDRVIVAACTPKLHETTFQRVLVRGGLNPYLFLPANVREQVSWAHPHEPEAATEKAIRVVRAAVAKARLLKPLDNVRVDAVHRALVIGGVTIPHERGLAGHSDADVLSHAICDALLGAAALGDIGRHFPDRDPAFRGISSLELLRRTVALLAAAGWSPLQVDATILAEAPLIAPHEPAMRGAIATALGIPEASVGIKATTTEGLGFVGRREGIAAQAVCLIVRTGGTP